jgi:hypothetical protein
MGSARLILRSKFHVSSRPMHTFHSRRYSHLAQSIIREGTNFPWQRSLRLGSRTDPTINIASPVTGMGLFQESSCGGICFSLAGALRFRQFRLYQNSTTDTISYFAVVRYNRVHHRAQLKCILHGENFVMICTE